MKRSFGRRGFFCNGLYAYTGTCEGFEPTMDAEAGWSSRLLREDVCRIKSEGATCRTAFVTRGDVICSSCAVVGGAVTEYIAKAVSVSL